MVIKTRYAVRCTGRIGRLTLYRIVEVEGENTISSIDPIAVINNIAQSVHIECPWIYASDVAALYRLLNQTLPADRSTFYHEIKTAAPEF